MNKTMIQELCNAFGPPGFENPVCQAVKKALPDFAIQQDAMNNLIITHPGNQGNRLTVQLDAHLDEVGFMVQAILKNGTMTIVPMGGYVPSSLPSQTLLIKNNHGEYIRAIVVSKPPHFKTTAERANEKIEMEQMLLDVGASSREEVVEVYGIRPGDPCAPEVSSEINEKTGIIFGKAFDNRLGCAAIVEIMNRLKDVDLPVDLVAGLASQEEVGMRGATVTSQIIKPDAAIVFEGSPADDLYYDECLSQGALHKGVQIRHLDASYISHRPLIDFALGLARDHRIKTQSAIRRGGSTNAGRISLTHHAVPCLVLGIPSRFIHTHHNFAALEDFQATVELACQVLQNLSQEVLSHEQ